MTHQDVTAKFPTKPEEPPPEKRAATSVASRSGGANEKVTIDAGAYNSLWDSDKADCRAFNLSPLEAPLPPEFTEEDLALRVAERYGARLRYVAPWGKWLWLKPGGCRWVADDTLYVFDLIRQVCREAAAECVKPSVASALASAKTVAAVERLTRSDRCIAATVYQWDADPWLLNTPAGALDLRNGESCRKPRAYLTKSTAVKPGGDCPLWRDFLKRITDGNAELERFLQRMAGYCLTGSTREHALFFLYGTGANGKSVLLNTVSGIMGDYARSAPIETFTASSVERHPTDLASLRGARLVMAVETEEGRRWAEWTRWRNGKAPNCYPRRRSDHCTWSSKHVGGRTAGAATVCCMGHTSTAIGAREAFGRHSATHCPSARELN